MYISCKLSIFRSELFISCYMEHSQSVMHLLSTVEATFELSYSIELTLKAKERTGGPNLTLRTLNNAKPYFFKMK